MAADDPFPAADDPAAADDAPSGTPRLPPLDLTLRSVNREPLGHLLDGGTSDLVQIRPIEWESLTTVGSDEEHKAYQTDSELQSIIEDLASKIVGPEDTAPRGVPKPGPRARSYGVPGVGPELPDEDEAEDDAVAESSPEPAPAPVASTTATVPAAVAPAEPAPAEPASAEPASAEPVAAASASIVDRPTDDDHPTDDGTSEPQEPDAVEPVTDDPSPTPAVDDVTPAPASLAAPTQEPTPDDATTLLASVPDATVEDAPGVPAVVMIDGPLISAMGSTSTPTLPASGPAAPVASPSLPDNGLILPRIEPKPGAARPTKPVDFHSLLGDTPGGSPPAVRRRRKRRNPIGGFLKLVLVLGVLAGGAYLGKKYFLDQRWPGDVEPIATDVAAQRGLDWERAVPVEALPPGEYALRLAESMLGYSSADTAALAVEWRAMGLAEGAVDLAAIGSAALGDQPAFYDHRDETVYVIDGLSDDLREIVLTRALGNALLDQHFGWGALVDQAGGESVALGVRGLYDGDALSLTADMVAALIADPERAAAVTSELQLLRAEAASLARGVSPYAAAIVGRPGDPTRHLFTDEMTPTSIAKTSVEEIEVLSDAAVYDGFRSRTSQPVELTQDAADGVLPAPTTTAGVTTSRPARTAGMIYWYYVLAGRMDSTTAWLAALAWNGDVTQQALLPDGRCVTSTIATVDAAGQERLLAALQRWAAAAPAESQAQVAPGPDLTISVSSCDPGPAADTVTNGDIAPFGNAEAELVVPGDLLAAGLPRTEAARQCVILAVRAFGIPELIEPTSVDPTLAEPRLDLTGQAARDLMAGCANA